MSQAHRHIVLPSFRDVFASGALQLEEPIIKCLPPPISYHEDKFLELDPTTSIHNRATYFNVSSERGLWETDPRPLLESTRAKWRSSSRKCAPRSSTSRPKSRKVASSQQLESKATGTRSDDLIVMDGTPDLATPPPGEFIFSYHEESSSSPQSSPSFVPSYSLPPSSPPSSPLSMIFSETPDDGRSISPFSEGMELEFEPEIASKVEEMDDPNNISLIEPDFIPDLSALIGSNATLPPPSSCSPRPDTISVDAPSPAVSNELSIGLELSPQRDVSPVLDTRDGAAPALSHVYHTDTQPPTTVDLAIPSDNESPSKAGIPCIPCKRPALEGADNAIQRKKPRLVAVSSLTLDPKELDSAETHRGTTDVQNSSTSSDGSQSSPQEATTWKHRFPSEIPASQGGHVTTTSDRASPSSASSTIPSKAASPISSPPSKPTAQSTQPSREKEHVAPTATLPKKSGPRVRKVKTSAKPDDPGEATTKSRSTKRTKANANRRTKPSPQDESDEDEQEQASSAPPLPPLPTDVDPELLGMLIETLATSRASSLTLSATFKSMMSTRPALKQERSDQEWSSMLLAALEAGNGGVFGKVESSGKDASDRPLEARWFYNPECDADQERASLVRSMMPRPSKRSVTKRYKQYYYQPLGKLSRWAGEDEL